MKSRASRARRGVLLLVILGLLAIFALVAVTFVVLAGHARRGAETARRIDQQADPPRQILHQVALQALRGSNNPASVIGPHGLLEDIYGNFRGEGQVFDGANTTSVIGGNQVNGGQLIQFAGTLIWPRLNKYFPGGCVLTMLDGPAAGRSTRIVAGAYIDVSVTPNRARFQILAFDDVDPAVLLTYMRSETCRYLINGTPFSGTGFGYNGGDSLDAIDGNGWLYGLLPNPAAFPSLGDPDFNPAYPDPAGPGGANEDYDAVDYQNMLLGAQIPDLNNPGQVLATIPSLHRPALINYWFYWLFDQPILDGLTDTEKWLAVLQPYGLDCLRGTGDEPCDQTVADYIINAKRQFILRPLPEDHPNFNGSNPQSRLVQDPETNGYWERGDFGRWDVDNDGDGVADSIWVDAGLPVRSTPDGRLYKPLAAILCLDMDGRLNLNAHGCWAQTLPDYYGQAAVLDPLRFPDPTNLVDGSTLTASLARGQGYGPAEINLRPLFESPSVSNPLTLFQSLLVGSAGLDGRFGESNASGIPAAGLSNSGDLLSFNKHFDFPNDYYTFAGSYGSPADLKGSMAIGLDLRGQPLYPTLADAASNLGVDNTQPLLNATINDPYELDLSRSGSGNMASPAPVDNPFSPAELERLLRPFDRDTSRLPGRLAALTSPDPANEPSVLTDRRHELTTESWDLPVPNLSGLRLASGLQVSHIEQLLFQRLDEVNGGTPAEIRAMMKYLLPAEVLAGLRMDLNRPFGNGLDDNGNGVVDEPGRVIVNDSEGPSFYDLDPIYPGEIAVGGSGNPEKVPQVDANGTDLTASIKFHHANGINVDGKKWRDQLGEPKIDLVNDADRALARQLYARHLYVLMMLLTEDTDASTYIDPWRILCPAGWTDEKVRAHVIAQWAVNVVDFRDRDSIMTAFEYDIHPFTDETTPSDGNPWDVDSEPSSGINLPQRGLVWGCERPELLISETLVFHDRRTEDLDTDTSGHKTTDDTDGDGEPGPDNDDDFDQRWMPQGSLFVELYNPWSADDPPPGEFYNNGGVALQRLAPEGCPVWRMIIVNADQADKDPDDPEDVNDPASADPIEIDRAVYFVGPSATLPGDGDVQVEFRLDQDNRADEIAPILPGRYAMIGPGESDFSGTSLTYIGFEDGKHPGQPGTARRIELTPNSSANTQQVAVFSDAVDDDLTKVTIKPAVAVVINEPQRLSISELPDGYDSTNYDPTSGYAQPYDEPLDKTNDLWDQIKDNGNHDQIKIIHLQRLANPLEPYDSVRNPYRTIDTMPLCLTTFNGVTNEKDNEPNTSVDETGSETDMLARERGEYNAGDGANNLWRQEPLDGSSALSNGALAPLAIPHYFPHPLHHTLGYLNYEFFKHHDPDSDPATSPVPRIGPAGYEGDPPLNVDGTKNGPFPWLTWNNRPLVSAMELLQVPYTRSSKLLAYYGAPNSDPYTTLEGTYSHLLNFFQSGPSSAPEFHRLLGFVHVPSRFVGTEIQANPVAMAAAFDPASSTTNLIATHSFYPPFNKISRYRDPGRVNINTIFSPAVWQGVTNFFPDMDPNNAWKWQALVDSRRGYGNSLGSTVINSDYPTRFTNPFRSASAAYLVPLDPLKVNIGPEINATMLRTASVPADGGTEPLFVHNSPQPFGNSQRNPYFRYQGLQRLGNLVTTRSNVYAVWITIGYFEVEPWADGVDSAHRDGFALGQELGIDTGEIKRHRAFYLFDRTIPVGFQRGKDLNVEDAIRLKRFIE